MKIMDLNNLYVSDRKYRDTCHKLAEDLVLLSLHFLYNVKFIVRERIILQTF